MFRLLNSLDTETLLKNKALLSVFITDNPRRMRIRGETILFVELGFFFFFGNFFSPESIVKGNTEIRRLCKTKRFRWVWDRRSQLQCPVLMTRF